MRPVIERLLALPECQREAMQAAELARFGVLPPGDGFLWVMADGGPVRGGAAAAAAAAAATNACAPRATPRHPVAGGASAATLDCGTVGCAELLCELGYHPAVLNFAHGYNCGGGFEHAAGSQEEDLFRHSSLFLSLWPHRRDDDGPGKNKRGLWIGDFDEALPRRAPFYPHSSAGGIYSPYVRLLDSKHVVGVLTVAAQDCQRERPFRPDLLRQKLRTAMHLAQSHDHDALVLGAFGSGYFENPPEEVAAACDELLQGEFAGYFSFVAFGVPRAGDGRNFRAFAEVFPAISTKAVHLLPLGDR